MGAAEVPAVPAPGTCGDALAGAHHPPRSPTCSSCGGTACGRRFECRSRMRREFSRPVLGGRRGASPGASPLRYSTGDRLSARGRGEAASRGAQGQAGAVRPVAPRGQDPADQVRGVRRRATSSCRAATPETFDFLGLHALLRKDQERPVRGALCRRASVAVSRDGLAPHAIFTPAGVRTGAGTTGGGTGMIHVR